MNYQEILKAVEEAVASMQEMNEQIAELSTAMDKDGRQYVEIVRRRNRLYQELREAKTVRKDLSKALDALRAKLIIRIDTKEVE